MRVLPYGDHAMLADLDSLERVHGLVVALQKEPVNGIAELVPGARTVLVKFDPAVITGQALATWLRRRRPRPLAWSSDRVVEVPVVYDGPDIADVAMLTGLNAEEMIDRHVRGRYTVAFCGVAPGFGYLVGGEPTLRVPRRTSSRSRIPAGAVALAGEYTCLYPRPMPGRWQLIGRTDVALWDIDRDPPALLVPGTQVVFVRESR